MTGVELSMPNGEVNEMIDRSTVQITRISNGLGFGSGNISGSTAGLSPELGARIDQVIEQSPNILVPVDSDDDGLPLDDDGCGDGRGVGAIFKGAKLLKRSLNRAKVFGGGLTMTVAGRIGLGEARGKSLNEVFNDAQGELDEHHIEYGAHTDSHAQGENCGCGAIDKSPEVVQKVVTYELGIRQTIAALGVNDEGLNEVIDEYKAYAAEAANKPFSGRVVMDNIIDKGKVVKRLEGDHKEKRIILNMVQGTTVNQQLVRDVSDENAQVFVTDVWRLKQIAERLHPDDSTLQQRTFLSQLVYSLGVAGTLTPGDLPVYVIDAEMVAAAA